MKHAFSNVTAEGLIAAIKAIVDTPRTVSVGMCADADVDIQQIVTFGRHNVTGEWIVNVSDAADGDTTTGEGLNHRTFSSPELSHAIYSALVDHNEAMDVFKAVTGWEK